MIRNHRRLGDTCGDYPAASSFAAQPYRPLTPDENARYLAAAAVYNACKQTAVGAPQDLCPPGSSFQGGQVGDGPWQGKCVSTFTGQPTTDLITAPARAIPNTPTPTINYATTAAAPAPFGQRGSSQSGMIPIGRPIAQTAPAPPPPDPGGVLYQGTMQETAASPSVLDSIPTWAKWTAAAGAAYFILFRK